LFNRLEHTRWLWQHRSGSTNDEVESVPSRGIRITSLQPAPCGLFTTMSFFPLNLWHTTPPALAWRTLAICAPVVLRPCNHRVMSFRLRQLKIYLVRWHIWELDKVVTINCKTLSMGVYDPCSYMWNLYFDLSTYMTADVVYQYSQYETHHYMLMEMVS